MDLLKEPLTVGDRKRSIGLKFSVLARHMRRRFDQQMAEMGVTRSQWTMIAVVSRNPGSTQRSIADALEMSEASAGRLVDRLCADGLLQRVERDDDRRARAVYLTKRAEPLLAKISDIAKESEVHVFRGFSEDELNQLEQFIERLARNLG